MSFVLGWVLRILFLGPLQISGHRLIHVIGVILFTICRCSFHCHHVWFDCVCPNQFRSNAFEPRRTFWHDIQWIYCAVQWAVSIYYQYAGTWRLRHGIPVSNVFVEKSNFVILFIYRIDSIRLMVDLALLIFILAPGSILTFSLIPFSFPVSHLDLSSCS